MNTADRKNKVPQSRVTFYLAKAFLDKIPHL